MTVTEADLELMRTRITESIHPEQIILFGSYARGDAKPDSDVDLLVITSESYGPHNSRRKPLTRLERSLSRIRIPVDIVLSTVEEVSQWRDATNHLIAHAMREGRVLYERS
ncbi:MAG: nucleotidyltransferase domain-containing protein [Magnetococcales bacterium]|nr:nucleotidyltransferase domain-containing protein [Magnetococcales bacterium]